MTRPEKTYPLTLEQIQDLSDAICELDGIKHFYISGTEHIPAMIEKAHDALIVALGHDAHLVYGRDDPEIRPA